MSTEETAPVQQEPVAEPTKPEGVSQENAVSPGITEDAQGETERQEHPPAEEEAGKDRTEAVEEVHDEKEDKDARAVMSSETNGDIQTEADKGETEKAEETKEEVKEGNESPKVEKKVYDAEQQEYKPPAPPELPQVRLDSKVMPNIEQPDFKIMESMTHSENNTLGPYKIEIEGPLKIEGKKRNGLFLFKIPTPNSSIAKTTVIERSIGNINLYAKVLAQLKGSNVSVPPSPYIKELYEVGGEEADVLKLEFVRLFFEFIALHQELRGSSSTKAFFCVPRERQKNYFTQASEKFEYENKESISDSIMSTLKHGFNRIQERTKKTRDPREEEMINDNVQKHVKKFIKTTQVELTDAAAEALELYKRFRACADNYASFSRKLGKAIATVDLANESASNEVLFKSAVSDQPSQDTDSQKQERIAGDVTIEILNKFIGDRPFVPLDEQTGFKLVPEVLGRGTRIFKSYSEELLYTAARLIISVRLIGSLLPLLKQRARLVDAVISCRKTFKKIEKNYEHENEKKQRAQESGAKGNPSLAKYEAECELLAKEKHEAAEKLTNSQRDLINFTNNFFYSYNAVCVSVQKHLGPVRGDVVAAMTRLGQRLVACGAQGP